MLFNIFSLAWESLFWWLSNIGGDVRWVFVLVVKHFFFEFDVG